MAEEKTEQKGISHKSRFYASVIFLAAFLVVAIIWLLFFAASFQPDENAIMLLIFFLVLVGLAILPWLPLLFPREPPGGPPLEDL